MYGEAMELEPAACDCTRTDVRSDLPESAARALADRLAALADPTRLRLLEILGRHGGTVCVCDLVQAISVPQPTISHHLRVLRSAGLVDYEKHGTWAYYFVRREALRELESHLRDVVSAPAPAAGG